MFIEHMEINTSHVVTIGEMKHNGKLPRRVAPRAISSDTAALGVDEDVPLLALLECPLRVDSGRPLRVDSRRSVTGDATAADCQKAFTF